MFSHSPLDWGLVALYFAFLVAVWITRLSRKSEVVDYLVAVDPETLQPIAGDAVRCAILVAGKVGAVRLLDNVLLE